MAVSFETDLAIAGLVAAVFAILVATGVTIAMDARTKGEFWFAAGCFVFSAIMLVATIVLWGVTTETGLIKRVIVTGLLFASVGIGMVEAVRWTRARHFRANRTEHKATPTSDSFPQKVNVELKPSSGPSAHMLLEVKNLGSKDNFRAQCQLLARRNDRNKMRLITFDLGWDNRDGREVSLATGESCNLLIATAKKEQDMERVDLWEFSKLESAEWSRWHHGDKLPEYDLEVTVFGDQCITPYAEQFTLRAGKAALEMFKITEPVAVSTGSEFAIVVEHCLVQECTYDHLAEMMNDSIIRVGSTHLVALVDFITTEWRIVNLRAKITYCDSKARPYQSVDIAPWKDFIGLDAEMEVGQGAKLVVALSDHDGNVFCPQRVQEAGGYLKLFQQVELKKGRGYASIRLNYEIQGIKATQSFFFSMFLGKGLKIERIAAMPHAA